MIICQAAVCYASLIVLAFSKWTIRQTDDCYAMVAAFCHLVAFSVARPCYESVVQ
jgi:hypothetical protein